MSRETIQVPRGVKGALKHLPLLAAMFYAFTLFQQIGLVEGVRQDWRQATFYLVALLFAAGAVYFLGWARGSKRIEDDPVNLQLRSIARTVNTQVMNFANTRNPQHLKYARQNTDLMEQTVQEAPAKQEAK